MKKRFAFLLAMTFLVMTLLVINYKKKDVSVNADRIFMVEEHVRSDSIVSSNVIEITDAERVEYVLSTINNLQMTKLNDVSLGANRLNIKFYMGDIKTATCMIDSNGIIVYAGILGSGSYGIDANFDYDSFLDEIKGYNKQYLTLDIIKELAQKGKALSWSDFEPYKDEGNIGSGLYILAYDVGEDYYLLIGGGDMHTPPMYIKIFSKSNENENIDIRTENIDDFINANQ